MEKVKQVLDILKAKQSTLKGLVLLTGLAGTKIFKDPEAVTYILDGALALYAIIAIFIDGPETKKEV